MYGQVMMDDLNHVNRKGMMDWFIHEASLLLLNTMSSLKIMSRGLSIVLHNVKRS